MRRIGWDTKLLLEGTMNAPAVLPLRIVFLANLMEKPTEERKA
jgi:hypothetical protein